MRAGFFSGSTLSFMAQPVTVQNAQEVIGGVTKVHEMLAKVSSGNPANRDALEVVDNLLKTLNEVVPEANPKSTLGPRS